MDLEVSSQFLIEVLYCLVKYVFEIERDVITCSILFTNIIDVLVFCRNLTLQLTALELQ